MPSSMKSAFGEIGRKSRDIRDHREEKNWWHWCQIGMTMMRELLRTIVPREPEGSKSLLGRILRQEEEEKDKQKKRQWCMTLEIPEAIARLAVGRRDERDHIVSFMRRLRLRIARSLMASLIQRHRFNPACLPASCGFYSWDFHERRTRDVYYGG